MKAILLAAGLGTRLRPLTDHTPKVLVPVCDKPVLEYWLESLNNAGINDILVNTHYLSEKVNTYLTNSPFEVKMVHEKKLLGTGGTLLANKVFCDGDQIMLIHADNISIFDMEKFILAHQNRPKHCVMTMMTFETEAPSSCGIVELNSDEVVIDFHEKVENPPGNHANAAVYIIENSIMPYLESLNKEFIDFSTDVIPAFMGRIYTWHNDNYHRDIGTPESYRQANTDLENMAYKVGAGL